MIEEETLEITMDEDAPLELSKIEQSIHNKGLSPIRYSLIKRENGKITLGVSGIKIVK